MTDRVPYFHLTPDEREAVHQWVRDHNLRPKDVPVDGRIELDETTNEWRIQQFAQHDGEMLVGFDGEPVKIVVRRTNLRNLPWRTQ
jgi:hypothetical protein